MERDLANQMNVDRAPGSLTYTGKYVDVPVDIEMIRFREEDYVIEHYSTVNELPREFDSDSVWWFNLTGLNDPEVISFFGRRFGIHEMHLEDIVQISQHSKVDMTDNYLMSEHYMLYRDSQMHRESIVLFLFENVVLSFQEYPGDVFAPIRRRIRQTDSRVRREKADYLYYLMIDRLVDEAVAVLKELVGKLDDMERLMIDEDAIDIQRAYAIKRELLNVKSAIYPLDDLLGILIGEQNSVIREEMFLYIKDVGDHVDQAIAQIGRAMDTIESMNQSNMAKLSNQMNSIMKVLTMFSAIFIPLNFLTGMYGMNFLHMPFLRHPHAFYGFLLASALIACALIAYFKKKKWL